MIIQDRGSFSGNWIELRKSRCGLCRIVIACKRTCAQHQIPGAATSAYYGMHIVKVKVLLAEVSFPSSGLATLVTSRTSPRCRQRSDITDMGLIRMSHNINVSADLRWCCFRLCRLRSALEKSVLNTMIYSPIEWQQPCSDERRPMPTPQEHI